MPKTLSVKYGLKVLKPSASRSQKLSSIRLSWSLENNRKVLPPFGIKTGSDTSSRSYLISVYILKRDLMT